MTIFALDENVFLWAVAGGGPLETVGGRYRKVGNDYQEAGALVRAIAENLHTLAYSTEWLKRLSQKTDALKASGVAVDGDVFRLLVQMTKNLERSKFEHDPPETPLPPDFPDDDRYLAYLAIATGATLVTEDEGVLDAAASGDWGFEAIPIAEALRRARVA